VPEHQILRSLASPENSIKILAEKTDLVVRIWNEDTIILKSVEDHSGNWFRGLEPHFQCIAKPKLDFPLSLGPVYYENTSLVGHAFLPVHIDINGQCNEPDDDTVEGYVVIKVEEPNHS
jgi:hypothetical protein